MCWPACHTPNGSRSGSRAIAIRPIGPTSIGATTTVPPAAVIRPAAASASSLAKYVVHRGGSDGSCWGARPAASRPLAKQVR